MLTIRKEQLAIFQKVSSQNFENRMLSHIKKFFPKRMEELGEPGTRELIRYGIQRSASYRIRKQPDICKYIGIMVVFGRDFDRDPKLPWASTVLNDRSLPGPSVTVGELHKAAIEFKSRQESSDGESQPT
jgi:hypothetical protein